MSTTTRNRLESRYGGITLEGRPHALTAWFVVALRIVMGTVMLQAGFDKATGDFSARGFLANVDPASPLSGVYGAMAADATLMAAVDVIVPATQLLIGIGLLVGGLARLAALGGAAQMVLFYFGSWDVAHGYVNQQFVYAVVFLAVGAFAAGRLLGADRYIDQIEVGGEPLIERFPRLRYVLG